MPTKSLIAEPKAERVLFSLLLCLILSVGLSLAQLVLAIMVNRALSANLDESRRLSGELSRTAVRLERTR